MTEWLERIGEFEESAAFRAEDNAKAERLEALYQGIGVEYERPERFDARDLATPSPAFADILATRGNELCAIRLVPKNPELPKLRQRGLPIRRTYEEWFLKQEINPDDYWAFLCPHSETLLWSGTFVVNDRGIMGTLIRGLHFELTHGDTQSEVINFGSDFTTWRFSREDPEAEREARRMVESIHVREGARQAKLASLLDVRFTSDHLVGYFEVTVWPDDVVRFIDFNRLLGRHFDGLDPFRSVVSTRSAGALHGAPASGGKARGRVRIPPDDPTGAAFEDGDVLVARNTDVRHLQMMQRAAAIVTEHGGILTHAAIVARELKKPCIVGVSDALTSLHDGDLVEVDADAGIVRVIERAL
jgi:phosphohistidine swiveling domain-containing protein